MYRNFLGYTKCTTSSCIPDWYAATGGITQERYGLAHLGCWWNLAALQEICTLLSSPQSRLQHSTYWQYVECCSLLCGDESNVQIFCKAARFHQQPKCTKRSPALLAKVFSFVRLVYMWWHTVHGYCDSVQVTKFSEFDPGNDVIYDIELCLKMCGFTLPVCGVVLLEWYSFFFVTFQGKSVYARLTCLSLTGFVWHFILQMAASGDGDFPKTVPVTETRASLFEFLKSRADQCNVWALAGISWW